MQGVKRKKANQERWLKAYHLVLQMLTEGTYKEKGRLPAEEALSLELGVSRTVLRDALAVLESEGYIIRTRGIGTVINQEVVNATGRLDLENDFLQTIRSQGYAAQQRTLSCGKSDEGFVVEKLYYASNRPAIYLKDLIPQERLLENQKMPSRETCETISFYRLLEQEGWGSVATVLMDMKPYLYRDLKNEICDMEVDDDEIILRMVERGFDAYGKENLISNIYYVSSLFRFSILTKAGHHKKNK